MPEANHHQLIIIGSGPAACTAAIYAGRAAIDTILFAGTTAPGGDLTTTTDVENFPGFPEGIQGPELMEKMQEQAEKFGTDYRYEDVEDVDVHTKTVTTAEGTYTADALIIATGSEYRKLNIPGEEQYTGRGVSWCATCDGIFFKNQTVVVIGGGDSAMEEAIHLTHHAEFVAIIHRSKEFKASKIMFQRAQENEKIQWIEDAVVTEIVGDGKKATGVNLVMADGQQLFQPADGVFIAIGSDPRTHLFHHQVKLTAVGTVELQGGTKTSVPGVFAAGDVADPIYRQAITAAGSGAAAALDVERYLQVLSDFTGE